MELARHRVRVNAIAPGYVLTEMNRESFFASDAGQAMTKRIPQRRIGDPSELDGRSAPARERRIVLHDRLDHRGRRRASRDGSLSNRR